MRTFLPLEVSDLLLEAPPTRNAWVASEASGLTGDALEAALEEVLDEAAFVSLGLVLAGSSKPRRLVAVGENPQTWDGVEAFYMDDAATAELIVQARAATKQDQLDEVVSAILSTTMDWYDGSELRDLRLFAQS